MFGILSYFIFFVHVLLFAPQQKTARLGGYSMRMQTVILLCHEFGFEQLVEFPPALL